MDITYIRCTRVDLSNTMFQELYDTTALKIGEGETQVYHEFSKMYALALTGIRKCISLMYSIG